MSVFEITKGGFSRTELLNMPYDEYHEVIQEVIRIQSEIEKAKSSSALPTSGDF